jgi:type IV conjugative transfer system protein TraL
MQKNLGAIPTFLNQADKVAFWTWNELTLFLCVVAFVWSLGPMLLGFVLGALSVHGLKTMQNSSYGDLTKGGLYWISPFSKNWYKAFPPSHIREFIG